MRKLVCATVLALGVTGTANAGPVLEIGYQGSVWQLEVLSAEGCTTCDVQLRADFDAFTQTNWYLDSVQIKLDGYAPVGVGDGSLTGTNAGDANDWSTLEATLNANQCGNGGGHAVCSEYGVGSGLLISGGSYFWNYTIAFDKAVSFTGLDGNIRAAFNDASGGNVGIFSPGGGPFDGSGGEDGSTDVPEPSTLALFGAALAVAGARLRRRNR